MDVHVLCEALALGCLNHPEEVSLTAIETTVFSGLFNPLVVVREPLEKVVIGKVHEVIGNVIEPFIHIAVPELGAPVAVVAKVKVLLQGLDGDEPLRDLGVGALVLGLTLGDDGSDARLDTGKVFVQNGGELADVVFIKFESVLHPVEGLRVSLVGPDGLRRLRVAVFVGEVVNAVVVVDDGKGVVSEEREDVGGSRLTIDGAGRLIGGVKGNVVLREGAVILDLVGRGVHRRGAGDGEVYVGDVLGYVCRILEVVIGHVVSFPV